MTLSSGFRLGPYEILSPLGAGGMGEVYRARDTRLHREVAVKVLPASFSQDPDRLRRFEQEARAASALNHPAILTIHDFGSEAGAPYVVSELLEGETLRERLQSGRLPLRKALDYAAQIARGLAAAHTKGIVHRDLKPENLFVTRDGRVKILDFGLAKLMLPERAETPVTEAPTQTRGTEPGIVMGTVGYMSPEQVRGQYADHRSDIFAFGAVLYEMLTGGRAFSGDTPVETMNAILKEDPPEMTRAAAELPPSLERIVRHSLEKSPEDRFESARDLAFDLETLWNAPSGASAAPTGLEKPRSSTRAVPWGLALLATVVAVAALWTRRPAASPAPTVKRFVLSLPVFHPRGVLSTMSVPTIVLSPDGSRLVYVARRASDTELRLREMSRLEETPIAGTEGGVAPFFSPEGRRIGFFSRGRLRTVDLSSGDVATLCTARWAWGGTWASDESIFFVPGWAAGIWRVPSRGGEPQVVASPDFEHGERSYGLLELLPGGRALLYTLIRTRSGSASSDTSIALLELSTGKRRILVEAGSNAHYASTGHLVYSRGGALLAVPFDLAKLQVTGPPKPAGEDVLTDPGTAAAQFSLAADGTLVYVPGSIRPALGRVVWVNRKGVSEPVTDTPRSYALGTVSPDGHRIAFQIAEGANTDIWVLDLDRGSLTRLTSDGGLDLRPNWTPSGERITFGSNRFGFMDLYWTKADGSEPEKVLLAAPLAQQPTSWSPDGRHLAYTEEDPKTGFDLWLLSLDGQRSAFLRTPFDERGATFSRDGRWLAYASNESGGDEIYVRPFPGPGPKWQISTGGGSEPVWARNGQELFYRNGDKMMAVAVSTNPAFRAGKPEVLFEAEYARADPLTSYDVAPDGRFAMVRGETLSMLSPLHVVLNWFEELERRVPAEKN